MADAAFSPDATLPEWLAAHARAVSARRLALDLAGGGLVALAAALWRPPGWPALLGAGLCFTAFGAWAVAERRLAATPPRAWPSTDGRRAAWRALRGLAAVVGTLAAALLAFALLFGVLGTWIS